MAINISGTVYTDEGVTPMGAGRVVQVSVNGAASSGSTTTASDGTYTLSGISAGISAVVVIYLQGNSEDGVVITKTADNVTNLTGVDIYQGSLSVRSDGAILSAANFATSDNNGATGLSAIYSCPSSSALTMASGKSLYVQSGQTMSTISTFVISLSGTSNVVNRGTMGTTSCSLTLTGSHGLTDVGCATLTVNTAGTVTLAGNLSTTSVALTAGTLDVSASNYSITYVANWSVTSGVFTCRNGTVTSNGTNATARTISGAAGPFNHLTLQGTAHTRTVTADLTLNGNLTISTGTLNLNGKNLSVAGNFANSSTFTANAGGVTLNGSSQTISGSSTFYDLIAATSGDVISFTDGTTQTVANSVTFQHVTLQGTSTGGWTIAMPATQTIDHVTVSYSTATGNTAVAGEGSSDGGNNVNWTFPAPPEEPLVNIQLYLTGEVDTRQFARGDT